uniref:Uncharacterized protein n=1 Tax=Oryza punctata TaxID=4537 RepID=A0A0E0M4W8_ORYPU
MYHLIYIYAAYPRNVNHSINKSNGETHPPPQPHPSCIIRRWLLRVAAARSRVAPPRPHPQHSHRPSPAEPTVAPPRRRRIGDASYPSPPSVAAAINVLPGTSPHPPLPLRHRPASSRPFRPHRRHDSRPARDEGARGRGTSSSPGHPAAAERGCQDGRRRGLPLLHPVRVSRLAMLHVSTLHRRRQPSRVPVDSNFGASRPTSLTRSGVNFNRGADNFSPCCSGSERRQHIHSCIDATKLRELVGILIPFVLIFTAHLIKHGNII